VSSGSSSRAAAECLSCAPSASRRGARPVLRLRFDLNGNTLSCTSPTSETLDTREIRSLANSLVWSRTCRNLADPLPPVTSTVVATSGTRSVCEAVRRRRR
jgi:hypothetical protein